MEERIFKLNTNPDTNCEACQIQDVMRTESENTENAIPQKKRTYMKGFLLRCIIAILIFGVIYIVMIMNEGIEDSLYTKITDIFTIEYTVDKETQIGKILCEIENIIETVLKQL